MSTKRKRERKVQRKQKNIEKERIHKQQSWDSGKILEENHNQNTYSIEFTKKLCERLMEKLMYSLETDDLNKFILDYRQYKSKIQNLIIYWNSEVPENNSYEILKLSLELYWDKDVNIINTLKFTLRNGN